jgi:hypothetical protein
VTCRNRRRDPHVHSPACGLHQHFDMATAPRFDLLCRAIDQGGADAASASHRPATRPNNRAHRPGVPGHEPPADQGRRPPGRDRAVPVGGTGALPDPQEPHTGKGRRGVRTLPVHRLAPLGPASALDRQGSRRRGPCPGTDRRTIRHLPGRRHRLSDLGLEKRARPVLDQRPATPA